MEEEKIALQPYTSTDGQHHILYSPEEDTLYLYFDEKQFMLVLKELLELNEDIHYVIFEDKKYFNTEDLKKHPDKEIAEVISKLKNNFLKQISV